MTTQEAAAYLALSVQRVHQIGAAGTVPRRRLGPIWLYRRADLDRYRDAPKRKGGRPKAGPS